VPEGFTKASLDEFILGGNRQIRMTSYQYSMLVERGPKGNVTCGLCLDTSNGEVTFALPTDIIDKNKTLKIGGLDIEFMLAPDTEAPSEMFFYIPKYKALTTAEHRYDGLRRARRRAPGSAALGDRPLPLSGVLEVGRRRAQGLPARWRQLRPGGAQLRRLERLR